MRLSLWESDNNKIFREQTLPDKIKLCISCATHIIEGNRNKDLTPIGLGERFQKDKFVQAKSVPAFRRYARVALLFMKRPAVYDKSKQVWKKNAKIFKISSLQSPCVC